MSVPVLMPQYLGRFYTL